MRAYWIHYSTVGTEGPKRFGIIESDSSGSQRVVTPPDRSSSAAEIVRLLISKGADPAEATTKVAAAMQNGIAHVLVKAEGSEPGDEEDSRSRP